MNLLQIFQTSHPVIGVVHLMPLPTSARWQGSLKQVIERATQEATALMSGGVHGIIVENFFDAPFPKSQVDPAVVSAMTVVIERLKQLVPVPIGVNVLRNDARSALAIAACTGAQFIRVNVLTGAMATDQGIIEGQAHEIMCYRRELGCSVMVLADVLVKHARPLGDMHSTMGFGTCLETASEVRLTAAVRETIERGLADGIILSGWGTGSPPAIQDLEWAKAAAGQTPVFIGSGADWHNIEALMQSADGVIVSSSLKRHGKIEQPIDPHRVGQFMEAMQQGLTQRSANQSSGHVVKPTTDMVHS